MRTGTLSRGLVVIMKVRGGVWLTALGPNPRYATRELLDMGVLPPGATEWQAVSGPELLGIMGRAQDVIAGHKPDAQAPAKQP